MAFHPRNSLDDNPSNWWSPSEPCLREMLTAAGFSDIEVLQKRGGLPNSRLTIGRIVIKAQAASTPYSMSLKVLPRRPSYMPHARGGGNRAGVER